MCGSLTSLFSTWIPDRGPSLEGRRGISTGPSPSTRPTLRLHPWSSRYHPNSFRITLLVRSHRPGSLSSGLIWSLLRWFLPNLPLVGSDPASHGCSGLQNGQKRLLCRSRLGSVQDSHYGVTIVTCHGPLLPLLYSLRRTHPRPRREGCL